LILFVPQNQNREGRVVWWICFPGLDLVFYNESVMLGLVSAG